jgi:protein-tyrosine phosphatase
MASVLFVCLGNICRSPAAEAIFRNLVEEKGFLADINVDSCGMGGWHTGHLPDERMREVAQVRGIILSGRAKQFDRSFFDSFDYILAADKEILKDLFHEAQTPEYRAKIHLITDFSTSYKGQDIPDPYYYREAAFEMVLDMLEDSCKGLLIHIQERKDCGKSVP